MALFMIERNFASTLNVSEVDFKAIADVNKQTGVRWLHSFLSADKQKSYCLYEAERGDAIVMLGTVPISREKGGDTRRPPHVDQLFMIGASAV